jgi:ribosomal protein L11 methyltransferase
MLPAAMLEKPNNAAHVMRLTCDATTALHVADVIVENFDPADTVATAFAETSDRPDVDNGPWVVEVYFGTTPDKAKARALIVAAAGRTAAESAEFSHLETRDWIAASLAALVPVRIGRFFIHGRHDRGAARANDLAIEIEAALAFGTGHHGSTRSCLSFIDRIAKRRRPRRVLDIGAGTGVLAIAAAKIFRCDVRAGDIDRVAVAMAKANARRNGIALQPIHARGLGHRALQSSAPYDLAIANILAAPLRQLAPALARRLAPGGEIILSGLLARDVPGVVSAYRMQSVSLIGRLDIDGWATLLMRRQIAPRKSKE